MDRPTPTFSAEQAVTVQRELRRTLGLEAETFPLPAFIGMISDEIEQMRAAGHGDQAICTIIERLTGQSLTPDELAAHYAPPALRQRPSAGNPDLRAK